VTVFVFRHPGRALRAAGIFLGAEIGGHEVPSAAAAAAQFRRSGGNYLKPACANEPDNGAAGGQRRLFHASARQGCIKLPARTPL